MRNKTIFHAVFSVIFIALLYWFDQFTKHLADLMLHGKEPFVLIQGVLELRYLENRGAAFGILQNQQWFFTILTLAFLVFAVYAYVKLPKNRYYAPAVICLLFLTAGALGNFYDRQVNQYVIDFIYFSLIDFPIFNVADIYVTCSVAIMGLLVLFHYKDEDFDFIFQK